MLNQNCLINKTRFSILRRVPCSMFISNMTPCQGHVEYSYWTQQYLLCLAVIFVHT